MIGFADGPPGGSGPTGHGFIRSRWIVRPANGGADLPVRWLRFLCCNYEINIHSDIALVASRQPGRLRVIYNHLIDRGKPAKVALTALMRHLIIQLNHNLKPNPQKPAPND